MQGYLSANLEHDIASCTLHDGMSQVRRTPHTTHIPIYYEPANNTSGYHQGTMTPLNTKLHFRPIHFDCSGSEAPKFAKEAECECSDYSRSSEVVPWKAITEHNSSKSGTSIRPLSQPLSIQPSKTLLKVRSTITKMR